MPSEEEEAVMRPVGLEEAGGHGEEMGEPSPIRDISNFSISMEVAY